MTYRNTLRSLQLAARRAVRHDLSATRAALEPMEARRLMSATAVKSIDSAGPDEGLVTVAGTTYVISSTRSGGSNSLLYSTRGPSNTTKKLVDVSEKFDIGGLDDLFGTADGRVFFTATGGDGGGRQLFQVNTSKGGYTQVTRDEQAFYGDVMVIENKIYLYDGQHEKIVTLDSKNVTKLVASTEITSMFQARGQLFFTRGDEGIFRTDGTAAGTYKVSGDVVTVNSRIFVSNDHLYFMGTVEGENTSLYRSDGGSSAPTKIADDFSLLNGSSAEVGDYVYFSGGYYNTSPKGGDGFQLCRVSTSTGEVSIASVIVGNDAPGYADAIYALGTSIYYTAGDGDYITSQGTTDRELFRYDTVSGVNKKITTGERLAPVDDHGDGGGAGVLGSYYFTAAPDKDEFRWGARKLYRTSPTDDSVVEVTGLPGLDEGATETRGFTVGSAGLFANVQIDDDTNDSDIFFVPTPYSYVDPVTKMLIVEATDSADTMTMRFDADEVIMNLNGIEERQLLSAFGEIRVALKAGDDRFTADNGVTRRLYVVGDAGNDHITGGGAADNILGGSGKNRLYGNDGEDRLRGSNGGDSLDGGNGNDRLYGWGGSDFLQGGNGVDYLYGDDTVATGGGNDSLYGGSGNDRLYGRTGNDVLVGGKQNDSLYGNEGDDNLQGQDGDDELDGGAGKDALFGAAGDDRFNTAADGAIDALDGGGDDDTLLGMDDDDVVKLIEVVN